MPEEIRQGRQLPTQSFVLPYKKTLGEQAASLYAKSGNTLLPWQLQLDYDIMAVDDEGLWVHQKVGYSVPRRNGKSENVLARCLRALECGERVLYTAHRTSTSHAVWERLERMSGKQDTFNITSSFKAFGKEHLYADTGGVVEFRTRTSSGGLGEGYDILIIDEAQEYTEAQETSLKYVVSDSKNPQTIMLGTPPTVVSAGTVFEKFRNSCLSGEAYSSMWYEWSVSEQKDPHDVEAWYETNPSLGSVLTERVIRSEISTDDIDFNIQRLGMWLKYNQKSEITQAEWEALAVPEFPKLKGPLYVGIKYGKSNKYVALSIAVRTKEDKIFVETLDCQPIKAGNNWILALLKTISYDAIIVDGAGETLLASDMKDIRMKSPDFATVGNVIEAHVTFTAGLSQGKVCHMNQLSLAQSASNCGKRTIGSAGGYGYKSIKDGVEVALIESAVLAYWLCDRHKEKRKVQRANY